MRCSVSPTIAAGTVTTRSTVATLVYGSSGDASVGASEIVRTVGAGVGVAVTPSTKPENVRPKTRRDGPQAARPDIQDADAQRDDGQGQGELDDERQCRGRA